MSSGQRFRLANCKPYECDRCDGEEHGEYRAPASQLLDPLPEGRGDSRNEDEEPHGEGHQTRHLASRILIAHQRHGHDPRRRDSDALQHTACDHHLERAGVDAHEASNHEKNEARMDSGFAPDTVGKRPEHDLTNAESQEYSRNDELDIVPMHHPKIPTDRRQRRQHRVDRKRNQRRQQRDEGNEFPHTKGGRDGCTAHSYFRGALVPMASAATWARSGQMGLSELYFVKDGSLMAGRWLDRWQKGDLYVVRVSPKIGPRRM